MVGSSSARADNFRSIWPTNRSTVANGSQLVVEPGHRNSRMLFLEVGDVGGLGLLLGLHAGHLCPQRLRVAGRGNSARVAATRTRRSIGLPRRRVRPDQPDDGRRASVRVEYFHAYRRTPPLARKTSTPPAETLPHADDRCSPRSPRITPHSTSASIGQIRPPCRGRSGGMSSCGHRRPRRARPARAHPAARPHEPGAPHAAPESAGSGHARRRRAPSRRRSKTARKSGPSRYSWPLLSLCTVKRRGVCDAPWPISDVAARRNAAMTVSATASM